jgi:hypothetical protein
LKTGKPRRVNAAGFSVALRLSGIVRKRHANPAMSLSNYLPPKYPDSPPPGNKFGPQKTAAPAHVARQMRQHSKPTSSITGMVPVGFMA